MSKAIRLIVGLGNVGASYEGTRHNAGFLFADEAARKFGGFFAPEKKFSGDVCRVKIDGREVFILKPSTFMNLSGIAVAALASFYKILPEEILVVHDELDLPPGSIKLKEGGGTAGHNGLKSITEKLGTPNFVRLRVGIGHPRNKQLSIPVADYVLTRPSPDDRQLIEAAVERGIENTALISCGNLKEAANKLNEKRTSAR